jgi:plasmid stabilization system protein ParE
MKYKFHPEAENELNLSIDYYEECQVGLGYDFAQIIYSAIEGIADYPDMWPVFHEDIQRRLVNRFPYAILYSNEVKFIYILAIMHLSRDPNYWKARLL